METDEYRRMFELEEAHWWYRGLRELVLFYLSTLTSASALVLDAGCGTGKVLETISCQCSAIGIDISVEALGFCRKRSIPVSRATITELPFENDRFDAVISLDVLYHKWVINDQKGLQENFRVLKPGGKLILHVPAYPILFGGHDRVVGTRRRYRSSEIKQKICEVGFVPLTLSYRNTLLFPLLLLHRLTHNTAVSDLHRVHVTFNRLLLFILHIENRVLTRDLRFPFGASLFCVATKPLV